jgi:hypothetical protein
MSLNPTILEMLNKRSQRLPSLQVPCCYECNQELQRFVEAPVASAIKLGYRAVRKLHPIVLFFWLGKMYYALRYRELFQSHDPKRPEDGAIVSDAAFKELLPLHCFLQGIRGGLNTSDACPWSLVVCQTKRYDDDALNFDYRDGRSLEAVALRVRSTGIVMTFGDQGYAEGMVQHLLDLAADEPLHPLQFAELYARMWYAAHLRRRPYSYSFNFAAGAITSRLLNNASNKMYAEYFDEWKDAEYVQYLAAATGFPVETLYKPPDLVRCFIHDAKGKVAKIPEPSESPLKDA